MSKIRVLVIAGNRLLGDNVASMLSAQLDIKADHISGIDDSILAKARSLRPQIVLFDSRMSDSSCVTDVQTILAEFPEAKVILMNLGQSHPHILKHVEAGVSGFLLTDATFDDYLFTVRSVGSGKKVLPPRLADSLLSQVVENPSRKRDWMRLSRREQQVVSHVAQGRSNQQIALELQLSVHTIKSHMHNILEKLGLHSRLELAAYAVANGLTTVSPTVAAPPRRPQNRKD